MIHCQSRLPFPFPSLLWRIIMPLLTIIWMWAHCDADRSQITFSWLGMSPKILKFHLLCDKSRCRPFHRPLAVDWWELPTSSYLITAGQGPVTRARCGFCCCTKQLRGSLRLLLDPPGCLLFSSLIFLYFLYNMKLMELWIDKCKNSIKS